MKKRILTGFLVVAMGIATLLSAGISVKAEVETSGTLGAFL